MKMKVWMAALLAALVLALGCAGLAEADANAEADVNAEAAAEAVEESVESNVDAVNGHIAFTEDLAPYEGRWVTFEDGFKLYLPKEWSRIDLDQTQQQAGLFYRAENGGSDSAVGETAMGVAVSFVRAGELQTLDDLAADFASAGLRRCLLSPDPLQLRAGRVHLAHRGRGPGGERRGLRDSLLGVAVQQKIVVRQAGKPALTKNIIIKALNFG